MYNGSSENEYEKICFSFETEMKQRRKMRNHGNGGDIICVYRSVFSRSLARWPFECKCYRLFENLFASTCLPLQWL